MGKQLDARTEWEVDAARRREVIGADFAGRHALRIADLQDSDPVAREVSRDLLSSLRAAFRAPATKVDDVPCDHAGVMTPVKPGA